MKNLSKKLFLSVMSVVLTFIALGTTTFAWFTMSGSVQLTGVTGSVKTPAGLEVSKDASTWYNKLDINQSGLILTDVTTSDGKTFYALNLADIAATPTATVASAATYYNQKLYVRVLNDKAGTGLKANAPKISLTAVLLPTISSSQASWTPDLTVTANSGDKSLAAGTALDVNALNAVRFSFVPYAVDTTATTVISGGDATNAWKFSDDKDFKTNSAAVFKTLASAVPFSIENSTTSLGAAKEYTTTANAKGLAQLYLEAKGINLSTLNALLTATPVTATPVTYTSTATVSSTLVIDQANFVIGAANLSLEKNYWYAVFDLNIWLEGWDADCINAIMGLTGIQLGFTLTVTA